MLHIANSRALCLCKFSVSRYPQIPKRELSVMENLLMKIFESLTNDFKI